MSEDATLLRTAVVEASPEPAPAVSSGEITNKKPEHTFNVDDTERDPAFLQEMKREPLATKLLGLTGFYHEVTADMNELDTLVVSELRRRNMKSTDKTYGEIVKEYREKAKVDDDYNPFFALTKILSLMRLDKKLLDTVKERDDLFTADITKLSSAQMKRVMKEKYGFIEH